MNIAIFDHVDLPTYYVEVGGLRYPRDSVLINYEQNDFIEQYKDITLVYKE